MFSAAITSSSDAGLSRDPIKPRISTPLASVVLVIVNLALLIFGCVMDTTTILLVAVPVLKTLGIDPVHFGIVMVINLLIGALTPPFGILLFVMTEVAKVDYRPLLRQTAPFYIPLFLFLFVVTYWPDLSLSLPNHVFGR